MKKLSRKLSLQRDTLRALHPAEIRGAAGGAPPSKPLFCEPVSQVATTCPPSDYPPCRTNWTCDPCWI